MEERERNLQGSEIVRFSIFPSLLFHCQKVNKSLERLKVFCSSPLPQLTKSYFDTATQQRNKILGLAAHPDLIIRFIRFRSRFTTSDPFRTTLSCHRLIIVRELRPKLYFKTYLTKNKSQMEMRDCHLTVSQSSANSKDY